MHDEHIISRSPYKDVEIGRGGYDVPDTLEQLPITPKFTGEWWKLTLWERVTLTIDDVILKTKLVVGITPYLFQSMIGVQMKNWKTTLTGIIGAIAYACNLIFGLEIPSDAILAVAIFAIGLFAKDSNVTGGTAQQ
ncbi:MAG: hypothetical protein IPH49_15785 [Ignavibacteria bacterium]|nr:hypothetical protein [Ignavibacteria bacterium]